MASSFYLNYLKWLRKTHGWIGLWGAALGLLFGLTGFLLNHRADPLKISTGAPRVAIVQLSLPQVRPASPDALALWVRNELNLSGRPGKISREPEKRVAWGDQTVIQPEQWRARIATPGQNAQIDYWVGNRFVTVKRSENTFLTLLKNLHIGVGLSIGWILLVDTIAASLIFLSITGILLWIGLNKRRLIGAVLLTTSTIAAIVFAML
jgi:uncharacterized protein